MGAVLRLQADVGAVLSQLSADGSEHQVGYFSKKTVTTGGAVFHHRQGMPHYLAGN